MAHEVKLEVYTLAIKKAKDDYISIDSYFKGNSFISFLQGFIKSLDNEMSIAEDQKKSFQFQKDSIKIDGDQRRISGIIESGEYGLNGKMKNIKTGDLTYQKTPDDADIKPFYFQIYFPKNVNKVFVVLQRTGIFGINVVFRKYLEISFQRAYNDLKLEFSQFVSKELARQFIENGGVQEISMKRFNLSPDICEKLGIVEYTNEIQSFEFRIKTKRGRYIKLGDKVKRFLSNENAAFFEIRELENIGFDKNTHSSIKVKLNGNSRTIDLSETGQIRPYYDIDDLVKKDSGHPVFESIHEIAVSLMSDLVLEIT